MGCCLPDELIEDEILPRLPAAFLIRFKCVSKFWYNTISHPTPTLIKSHLQHQTPRRYGMLSIESSSNMDEEDSMDQTPILLEYHPCWGSIDDHSFQLHLSHILNPPPGLQPPPSPYVLCSRDGLAVIGDPSRCPYILINPATRQIKSLPYPPAQFFECILHFDHDARHYKLLGWNRDGFYSAVYLYRSREDAWQELYPPNDLVIRWIPPLLCSGWIYWMTCRYGTTTTGQENHYNLLAFNMHMEQFKEIEMPNDGEIYVPTHKWCFASAAIDGRVHLLQHHCQDRTHPIEDICYITWILEDTNPPKWTKLCRVKRNNCHMCIAAASWGDEQSGISIANQIIENSIEHEDVCHVNSLVWFDKT